MRRLALLVALIAGLAASPAAAGTALGSDGLVRMASSHDVETTLDRFAEAATAKGLKVMARLNHAQGAANAGLDLQPTQVLIFGNPKMGTPLMNSQRSLAIDLPMKALAYEAEGGQVWLMYNKPSYLAERHGLTGHSKRLAKMATALEAFAERATQ